MKVFPLPSFVGLTASIKNIPFRAYNPATEVCQGMLPATLSHFGLTGGRRHWHLEEMPGAEPGT